MSKLTIGEVRDGLLAGKRYQRAGWIGAGVYLALKPGEAPEDGRFMHDAPQAMPITRLPDTILLHTAEGHDVPWCALSADMLADDWSEMA